MSRKIHLTSVLFYQLNLMNKIASFVLAAVIGVLGAGYLFYHLSFKDKMADTIYKECLDVNGGTKAAYCSCASDKFIDELGFFGSARAFLFRSEAAMRGAHIRASLQCKQYSMESNQ